LKIGALIEMWMEQSMEDYWANPIYSDDSEEVNSNHGNVDELIDLFHFPFNLAFFVSFKGR